MDRGQPVKIRGPVHRPGGAARIYSSLFTRRGPARLIKFREGGAWPGPAPSSFRGSAAAWTGASKCSGVWPRPCPAHDIFNFSRPRPARPVKSLKVSARPVTYFQIGPAEPSQTAHDTPWEISQERRFTYTIAVIRTHVLAFSEPVEILQLTADANKLVPAIKTTFDL